MVLLFSAGVRIMFHHCILLHMVVIQKILLFAYSYLPNHNQTTEKYELNRNLGHLEIVKYLIGKQANVHHQTPSRRTTLHFGSSSGNNVYNQRDVFDISS